MKNEQKIFLSIIILIFNVLHLLGQQEYTWQELHSPSYSNFKSIRFVNRDTAYVAGKQLYLMTRDTITRFVPQPPCVIEKMFAVSSKCIYVSDNSPYQNSNLYQWNGKIWQKIDFEVANYISDMYFSDVDTGVLVSYGEVVHITSGQAKHITPPTNRYLSQVRLWQDKIYVLSPGLGVYVFEQRWKHIPNSQSVKSLCLSQDKLLLLADDFVGQMLDNQIKILSKANVWKSVKNVTFVGKRILGVGNGGRIVRLSGKKITVEALPFEDDFLELVQNGKYLYAIGAEGHLLKYTDEKLPSFVHGWKGFEKLTFNDKAKLIDDEYGVVIADFNNDGLPDIFTAGLFEQDHLYINQTHNRFSDEAQSFGLDSDKNTKVLNLAACAGDLDNDGYIDLYISVLNGKNIIYKNIKGKYFVDVSKDSGAQGLASDRSNATAIADVDNDGDLDIFVANEYGTNRLYINNGAGIFSEITQPAGLLTKQGGNAASFADMDNDGDVDLYVTNWSAPNVLYRNDFMETGKLHFTDITQASGTGGAAYLKSNAAVWTDIDNDADLDLLVTNRKGGNRLYFNNGKGIFKKSIQIGSSNDASYGAVVADFDGDGFKDIYINNIGKNALYRQQEQQFVRDSVHLATQIDAYSTGLAISDLDADGDVDIYIANYLGESSALLINKKNDGKHLTLKIKAYQNNRNAVGAKIYVYDNFTNKKLIWFDEIRSGSGYMSANDFTKVIPLQNEDKVAVQIVFPNGIVNRYDSVAKNTTLHVQDVYGAQAYQARIKNYVRLWLFNPHHLFELIKWIFVLFFILFMARHFQKKYAWHPAKIITGSLAFILFYYLQYRYFEYDSFLYATVLPLVSLVGTVLLIYTYFDRKYVERMARLEKNAIKTKLSQDLHDDLAATVSSIGFYLTMIKLNLKEGQTTIQTMIQKSESLLQEASDTISDMIWSYQVKKAGLRVVMMRLQKNYENLFAERQIKFVMPKLTSIPEVLLPAQPKQQIYLILKEALHNVLKYADAQQVEIKIDLQDKLLIISVIDDGKGFDYIKNKNKGNGLTNMQRRAADIQADWSIQSKIGEGTRIVLRWDISHLKK